MASVLAAAPLAAADDPEPDYKATFSACEGVTAQGFEDVPVGHDNAGDIDCIAYYGITKGTSATTYSPSMSVTREQMALFLTRLAGLVGIDVAAEPDDAGFTDIGELSAESQTAINQLADLGITQGTSATTFSAGDSVRRGHMALFIARLMDHMDPMAEDSDTVFGYTPEDVGVVKVIDTDNDNIADEPGEAKSPFTDLDSVTKEAYDAITALWELGVASGISATSYGPGASITRAAMAEFMAGVLDHSNARPAGVTIQASKTTGFDDIEATVAVSYRDDMFMPMADVSIKTFFSGNDGAEEGVGDFTEEGGCQTATDCAWTDDDSLTDDAGNFYIAGAAANGTENTYYAWMGDPDGDDNNFNVDKEHASVTLSSTRDAVALKVTSDISTDSTGDNTVDIDATSSVTHTVQLVDENGDPVARSGVKISVEWVQDVAAIGDGDDPEAVTVYPPPAPLETDDDGKATFPSSGPKSTKGSTDASRLDTLTFKSDLDDDGATPAADTAGAPAESVVKTVQWVDTDPVLTSGEGNAPDYAVRNTADEVSIPASVTFYDQYGNTIGKGNSVLITIGTGDGRSLRRTVSSRGVASWQRGGVPVTSRNTSVPVTYMAIQDSSGGDIPITRGVTDTPVLAVDHAPDDSQRDAATVNGVYADDNRFHILGFLYTYDSNDIYIDATTEGESSEIDMDKFESLITPGSGGTGGTVQVVSYDDDGPSIFRVSSPGS